MLRKNIVIVLMIVTAIIVYTVTSEPVAWLASNLFSYKYSLENNNVQSILSLSDINNLFLLKLDLYSLLVLIKFNSVIDIFINLIVFYLICMLHFIIKYQVNYKYVSTDDLRGIKYSINFYLLFWIIAILIIYFCLPILLPSFCLIPLLMLIGFLSCKLVYLYINY